MPERSVVVVVVAAVPVPLINVFVLVARMSKKNVPRNDDVCNSMCLVWKTNVDVVVHTNNSYSSRHTSHHP